MEEKRLWAVWWVYNDNLRLWRKRKIVWFLFFGPFRNKYYRLYTLRINVCRQMCRRPTEDRPVNRYRLVCTRLCNETFIINTKIETRRGTLYFASLFLHAHLAKFILALCPPLNDTPLSPTIVLSPCGNSEKSLSNAHARIAYIIICNDFIPK